MQVHMHHASIYLFRAVCYPKSIKFTTTATKYGCKHEKDTVKQYIENMQGDHNEFSVTPVGLVVSTLKPMYGASPDSLIYRVYMLWCWSTGSQVFLLHAAY